jgi:hypothetical protein
MGPGDDEKALSHSFVMLGNMKETSREAKRAGGMIQVVECLPSNCETPSSNPSRDIKRCK